MEDEPDQIAQIKLYIAYLDDLGRIGGRHENCRKFYMSVISALFVFVSSSDKFISAGSKPHFLIVIAGFGALLGLAWFEHMRSFGKIFLAKLSTLRVLEDNLVQNVPLQPFTIETEKLGKSSPPTGQPAGPIKWAYSPLTLVDRILPVASVLLFVGLAVVVYLTPPA